MSAAVEARFRLALEVIARRFAVAGEPVGQRETGVAPNTVEALERRGLVAISWSGEPYRRLVCVPTEAGMAALKTPSS